MANSKDGKLKCIKILQYLQSYSSIEHPLKADEMIAYLNDEGIEAERKSIYRDIKALQQAGYSIESSPKGFYIDHTTFELAELKLLVDAIESSYFITPKKTKQLVEKLSSLTNNYDAQELNRQIAISKKKTENEQIFYNVDALHTAIKNNVEITFKYFDMTLHKEKKYRKNSKRYTCLPYALVWDNQQYYCIGYSYKYDNFTHYRVDRMENIEVLTEVREKKEFDLEEYTSKVFGMFSGEEEYVTLKVDRSLTNTIFDTFGQDVFILSEDESSFTIHVKVCISDPFIGWLIQFKNKIQVISPDSLIQNLVQTAEAVKETYNS